MATAAPAPTRALTSAPRRTALADSSCSVCPGLAPRPDAHARGPGGPGCRAFAPASPSGGRPTARLEPRAGETSGETLQMLADDVPDRPRLRDPAAGRTNRTSVGPAGCRRAIGTAGGSGSHDRRRPRHPVVRFSPSTGQNRTTARAAAAVVRFSRPPARREARGPSARPPGRRGGRLPARQGGAGADPPPRRAGDPGRAAQLECCPTHRGQPGWSRRSRSRPTARAWATRAMVGSVS
jgi:hypothetical protein